MSYVVLDSRRLSAVVVGAVLAFAGRAQSQDSRPASAPAADSRPSSSPDEDDPADVARVCELYNEARAAVGERDFESAVELVAEADLARSTLLRGAHEVVASTMGLLGDDLVAAGLVREALSVRRSTLATYRRLHNADHADTSQALNDVASCLDALGRPAEALPLHESSRAMWERMLSGDHEEVACARNDLALCLIALGRPKEALPICETALAMYIRLHQGDHEDVSHCQGTLADCLGRLGRDQDALPILESAHKMCARIYVGDHSATATSLNNLACGLESLGRTEDALRLFEASRAMRDRLYQGDHPARARGMANLAYCLQKLGRTAEALPLFKSAHAMRERIFHGDHPDLAFGLNDVGRCLRALGRPEVALPIHNASYAMSLRLHSGDHPEVAAGLTEVASCLVEIGRAGEALPLCEAACRMRRRLYDGDHPETAQSLGVVAGCLSMLDRSAEALPLFLEAREMRERLFGRVHSDSVTSSANAATCMHRLGRDKDALLILETTVATARKCREPTTPMLLRMSGEIMVALGDVEGAIAKLDEAASGFEWQRRDVRNLDEGMRPAYEARLGGRSIYGLLAEVHADRGAAEAAFTAMERGRRRSALDLLARSRFDPLAEARRRAAAIGDAATVARCDTVSESLAKAESAVARWAHAESMAWSRRDLDEAGRAAELERIEGQATEARGAVQDALTERARLVSAVTPLGTPASVAEVRRMVREPERLLAYSVGATKSRAFLVRPAGEPVVLAELRWPDGSAVTSATLAATVRDFRGAMTAEGRSVARGGGVEETASHRPRPTSAVTSLGRMLFAALMPHEIWTEVRAAGRIVLIPDGPLHFLPFEAMTVDVDAASDAPKYWIDVGPNVTYDAATTMLLEAAKLRDERRDADPELAVLAVGDPRFSNDDGAASRVTPPAAGVLVVHVPADSAGAAAGLRRGDVIVTYAGRSIEDATALAEAEAGALPAAEKAESGSKPTVPVGVWRVDGATEVSAATGKLGIEAAKDPIPAAWSKLTAGDETSVAVVERGGILGRRGPLTPLPGARREVLAISETVEGLHDVRFGRLRARALIGAAATETAVFSAAPKARVLHFATHYLADETERGGFSALALAAPAFPGAEDDGFLRVHDVIERWRDRLAATELVVLSACETVGGPGALDESIFAMPLAFLVAGVPSTVASLWRVEDQSTADLMADFYRRMFDPALNAATSERPAPTRLEHFTAARKAARARRPEPYFWAPFVWMGDPR